VLRDVDDEIGEATPRVVRFDARQQHQLAAGVGLVVGVDGVLGPDDRARDAVLEHHLRSHLLGVEEGVTVDRRQPSGAGELDEVVDRPGGGGRGVEVAGEGQHQDRRARGPLPVPHQLVHAVSLTDAVAIGHLVAAPFRCAPSAAWWPR
jgi:hypothetical protein